LERFAGKGVALCNLGVLDLLGRGAARGEICLKRGWQHIAVFVFWGNVKSRGVGFSGLVGSWFMCLAFLISLYHGVMVADVTSVLASGLFYTGFASRSVWRSGSWFFRRYLSYLLWAGSDLAKHRE